MVMLTLSNEQDIIEELVAFRCWLEQGDEHRILLGVGQISQVFDDLVGRGGVQTRRDFVLQFSLLCQKCKCRHEGKQGNFTY